MTGNDLQDLVRLTLGNPRAAASRLKALDLGPGTGWMAIVLVSVASSILGFIVMQLSAAEVDPAMMVLFGSPLRTALMQLAVLALTGVLAHEVGRRLGGTGTRAQALVLVAWVQVPLFLLQLVQLVAMILVPVLAPIFGIAGFALYAVLLSLFIAELHGFRSGLKVFFGMVATSLAVGLVAAILVATLIGVPVHV